ncbi:MAG: tRNA guanosine(34) transglycosylase Tgt [Planctomycetes bacterium]|nr:tRNA guanosine(34) transglycosylase Tgt [Planctomycetota bacterium]
MALPTNKTPTSFSFRLLHVDAHCAARLSLFSTPHGEVRMPAFMPVGTQATVKGLEIEQLRATGAEMVLANTYHLALRPGEETVAALGGLHRFMGWQRPILTDSGGFQLFSLAHRVKVTEQQAVFHSHIDGSQVAISPERSVAVQEALGGDVAMALDHVVGLPNEGEVVRDAVERTVRWARRCRDAATRFDQALFAIVQGGLDGELRADCARRLREMDFAGYAIGGLSVGEAPADMLRMIEATAAELPSDRPRYLMGVGRPEDLLEAIRRGVDLFDCVMPTRNGRNSMAFTDSGSLRLRNAKFERDERPLEDGCPCAACRRSRGYIRHLFTAGEMLGPILLSIHNLTYYQRLLSDARRAIEADRFEEFRLEKLTGWTGWVEPMAADSRKSDAT